MKKSHLAAIGLAAGVLGGAAVGIALVVPSVASAQSAVVAAAPMASTATTAPAGDQKPAKGGDPSSWMRDALAPLVAKGTITQAQADAVIQALQAARPAKPAGRGPGGFGGPGGLGGIIGHGIQTAASALGVSPSELTQDLRSGKTIAEVAKDKQVDLQKVIGAIVTEAKTDLADAVKAGKLTQSQADTVSANLNDTVTKLVNGQLPDLGKLGPGFGPGRRGNGGSTPPTSAPTS